MARRTHPVSSIPASTATAAAQPTFTKAVIRAAIALKKSKSAKAAKT